MANRFLSNITINDSYTLPSADGANGQVISTDGAGNLSFVDQTTEALTLNVTVKNVSGGSLAKGTIVHAHPSASPPSGNVVEVIAADYDTSASMPAIGVLNETLANEAEGQAIMFGAVSGIDTSYFSAGDELWVGNDGAFTNTKPATAGQLIQKIAVVIKSHASNGLIKIFGAGRTNDVPLPLYIDNTNQRVGIGTTSPNAKLHVNGGTGENTTKVIIGGNDAIIRLGDNQGGGPHGFQFDGYQTTDGMSIYYRTTPQQISFEDSTGISGNKIMVVGRDGSVGIGTTSPNAKLEVNGSADSIITSLDHTAFSGRQVGLPGRFMVGPLGNGYPQIGYNFTTANSAYTKIANDTAWAIGFGEGNRMTFKYAGAGTGTFSWSELMSISNTGKIGIGNTSPEADIHIGTNDGTRRIVLQGANSAANSSELIFGDSNIDAPRYAGMGVRYNSDDNHLTIRSFFDGANSADTEIARFDRTTLDSTFQGKVGIGTLTPGVKLDVKDSSSGEFTALHLTNTFDDNDAASNPLVSMWLNAASNNGYLRLYGAPADTASKHRFDIGSTAGSSFITFSTSADEKMRIANDGKVGIGTTSPLHKLDVSGNARVTTGLFLDRVTGQPNIKGTGEGHIVIDSVNDSHAVFLQNYVSGNVYMATGGGNVGIGTTSPSNKLHVLSSANEGIYMQGTGGGHWFNFKSGTSNLWSMGAQSGLMGWYNRTNSSYKMVITDGGNVGIGTTSPAEKLSVNGAIRTTGVTTSNESSATIAWNNTPNEASFESRGKDNTARGGIVLYQAYANGTNGLRALEINSSGNVGIGVTPAAWATAGNTKALQISTRGAISEAYDNVFLSNNYYFDGSERYIETNVASRLGCDPTGNIIFQNAPSGTAGSVITFEERMRIDSSGNVGIGTTSPAAKLVVRDGSGLGSTAGDYKFLAQFRGENVNQSYIEIKDVRTATGSDWTTAGMRIQGRIDSTYMGYMQFNGSGNNSGISFGTGATTTAPGNVTERMRITSSGSVGINTTSPQAKLDVKGGILTRNTRVDDSQAHPVGHYNEGEQVFGIDPTWSQSELQQFFNSSNVTWNADSTAPGGYAIYINGGVNVGGVYSSGFPYIPVDQDDYFYMEVWIKNAGSGQTHYMGSNEFNHGFVSLGGHPGSFGYWVMSNTNPGSSWTKVSGYIGGFSASTVGTFENGTKYWTPMALFNYGAGSGTRACYISGWKVYRVTQHGRRKFTGAVGVLGGSYSASIDSVSDAGLVVKQGRAIYSLANSDQYLRNLITHNSANHIIIGQLGTSLIADVFVYTGSSGNFRVYTNGTETMRLASDAKLHVENDIIAFSTTVSDARLKDDIVTIDNALDKVKALRGVEYVWNKGGREGQKDLGFIAQEVEQVIPEIVRENEMPLLDDSGEQYKTVDYEKVVAVLVEAIKEQQKQIDELKARLDGSTK